MVFLTPYVMDSQVELDEYARRRKAAGDAGEMWTQVSGSNWPIRPTHRPAAL